MNRNSKPICGTNTTTLPTPAMMPLMIRSVSGPAGSVAAAAAWMPATPDSITAMAGSDQVKRAWNTTSMTTAKTALP